jgi:hypothetical protein
VVRGDPTPRVPLPAVVPAGPTSFAGLIPCPDCARGYAEILSELNGPRYDNTTFIEMSSRLEAEHEHTFEGTEDWQVKTAQRYYIGHCHACHAIGERVFAGTR